MSKTTGLRMGRPPLYNNCMDFDAMCLIYFETMDAEGRPYTIPGLVYELGFSDRNSFREYEEKPEFTSTAKRARQRIEAQRAEQLLDGKGNPAGKIFDLKNNFGWKDKHEVQTDNRVEIVWGTEVDDGLPGSD